MTKVELYKSRVFVTIIHLCALGQFAYALYFNNFGVNRSTKLEKSNARLMVPDGFQQKIRFLTYWCLIVQVFYYTVCLINDFVGTNEVAPKHLPAIRKLKDYVMAAFAFPLAVNVAVTFWSLYAIDRELVFPKVLDAVFPSWLNHIMHTNILVFIILEMFTSFREYPKRKRGITGLGIFMITYLIWIHVVKHYSGVWVYPVLEVLQLPQRIVFFVAILAFTVCLYFLGEFLNGVVWAKEIKILNRKAK
ncbi:androgen-induced gene 1 protein isoform X2 [Teleopsis dalmanni]|uniref:androgen-induced gene 1 protein isoform X2 n=1 Tax=Teleopsis dalmanni TaxID=139649 RepID=UPI0018CC858A|nr:androgen-induced gene 1 protein isoform X2 [Teleopsis dalmanni]XP_037957936.1 androgen-induced gene 1 protein isoform X2 [Teleopsis dalmanni]XP_037957937.1 androgen-induced gene 1 protein isoform X2 [Teleopsis dalmanni]